MKKILLLAFSLLSVAAHAGDYLCSYQARISEDDKYNSKGTYLPSSGYNLATVAAIIRQDRANLYVFGRADMEDEIDCLYNKKGNRAHLERQLRTGTITQYAINTIIDYHPLITVDIFTDHVEINIDQQDYEPRQSSIQ